MKALFIAMVMIGFSASAHACFEGEQQLFDESQGEGSFKVLRTCHNGSFYAPVTEPKITVCKEGERVVFADDNGSGETMSVVHTCHNGSFYPKAKPVVVLSCREGAIEVVREGTGEATTPVQKVCHNGRWVNLF